MEELFYGLIGLFVIIAPFWALFANIRKTRRLESELRELQLRMTFLERKISPSPNTEQPNTASIQPHQLATLIDLEELKSQRNVLNNPESQITKTLQGDSVSQESLQDLSQESLQEKPAEVLPQQESSAFPNKSAESATPKTESATPKTESATPKTRIKAQSGASTEWEALIGGRLFNRIGAAAIVIGLGFFLKYAFDNDLISEPVRVLIGVFAGISLIAGAERLQRKKLPVFAQGLTGAGLGALYLSVFAAYNFYHLMPALQAFGGMIAVTVLGFVMALRHNALSIGLLAWFGGYITPLLIHSNQPNLLGLMSYLTILTAGMLALVLRRDDWFMLKPLSFIASYGVCGIWYANAYTTLEHFGLTTGFAVLFWLMFFGVDFYRAVTGRSKNDEPWRRLDSLLNSSVSYSALFMLIYDVSPQQMALWSIGYGAVYFLAAQLVHRKQPDHTFAFMRYTITAITQMVFATAQYFGDAWTITLWSAEFAFLIWASARWRLKFVNLAGVILSGVTLGQYALWSGDMLSNTVFISFWGHEILVTVILCAAFLFVAVCDERYAGEIGFTSHLKGMNVFHLVWVSLLLTFISAELDVFRLWNIAAARNYAEYWYWSIKVIVLAPVLTVLLWSARKYRWQEVTMLSLAIFAFGILLVAARGFAFEPAAAWTFILNVRVSSMLVVLAMMPLWWKISSAENQTVPIALRPHLRPIIGGSALLLLFTLCTGEASDFFHSQIMRLYALPEAIQQNAAIAEKITGLENAKQLAVSLVWLVFAAVLMIAGFVRRVKELRLVALGLAGVAILKIVFYDLSYLTTPYRIGSFIGLGVVLMLVSYLYQRWKDRIFDDASAE